jgi:hypothetical protein
VLGRREGVAGSRGDSLNYYDAARGVWHQTWAGHNQGGALERWRADLRAIAPGRRPPTDYAHGNRGRSPGLGFTRAGSASLESDQALLIYAFRPLAPVWT